MTMLTTLKSNFLKACLTGATALMVMTPLAAFASKPTPGGLNFQEPATELATEVKYFHEQVLLPIIIVISVFVLALLIWIVIRYNSKANPVAKQFSHHVGLEVAWTVIPIGILLFIALFSFDLLYKEDVMPDGKKMTFAADGTDYVFANDFAPARKLTRKSHFDVFFVDTQTGVRTALERDGFTVEGLGDDEIVVTLAAAPAASNSVEIIGGKSRIGVAPLKSLFSFGGPTDGTIVTAPTMTLKVNGYQWGWDYSYPDFGDFEFTSLMTAEEDLEDKSLYRLATTADIVVPEGEVVRVIVTAKDVIHSWAMPAFAIKIDAVPGRLNETWFKTPKAGIYYGQCSEICGLNHAFMPISLRSVPRAEFDAWVDSQRALAGMEPMFSKEVEQLAQVTTTDTGASGDAGPVATAE